MIETTSATDSSAAPGPGILDPAILLKAERIQLALRDLPGWSLAADESAIERVYGCTSVDAALTFLCYVLTTSFDRRLKARAVIDGCQVLLRLSTPSVGGVTQADLDFAHLIDQR